MKRIVFTLSLLVLFVTSMQAQIVGATDYQSRTSTTTTRGTGISPVGAWAASFGVTGLGQILNGDTGRGIAMMATCYGGFAFFIVGVQTDESGMAGFFFFGAAAMWIWSQIDAPISAAKHLRHGGLSLALGDKTELTIAPSVDYFRITPYSSSTLTSGINLTFGF